MSTVPPAAEGCFNTWHLRFGISQKRRTCVHGRMDRDAFEIRLEIGS